MAKQKQRPLYSTLAPYYDKLAPKTTKRECRFFHEIFSNYKSGKIIKVLDLGCGTGRHSCELTKMGYQVTGIDQADQMLKIARKKCPGTKFRRMDFTNFVLPKNYFDASICLWTTIGYLQTKRKFKQFVENVARVTKHLFIIDSSNYEDPAKAKSLIKEEGFIKLPQERLKISSIRRYNKKTRFRNDTYTYTIYQKNKPPLVYKDKVRLKMWSKEELKKFLVPKFKIFALYGDYALQTPYQPRQSKRIILIAQKIRPL